MIKITKNYKYIIVNQQWLTSIEYRAKIKR